MALLAIDLARAGIPTADWTRRAGIDDSSGQRLEEFARNHPKTQPYLPRWKLESEEKRRALDAMFTTAKRYVARLEKVADRRALALFVDAMAARCAFDAGWDPLALDALEFALRNSASPSLALTRTPLGSARRAQHAVSVRSSCGVDLSDWWADLIAIAIMVVRLDHDPTWWPETCGWRTREKIADFIKQRRAGNSAEAREVVDTASGMTRSVEDIGAAPQAIPAGAGSPQGTIRHPARRRRQPTFSEAFELWIAELRSRSRVAYANSVDEVFKHHLLPAFGDKPVGRIGAQEVADFQARLQMRAGRHGLLTESTVNKVIGHLSRFLRAVSPLRPEAILPKAEAISPPNRLAPTPQVFTPDQVDLICASAPEAYRDYIKTGFATGMTTSELNGLRWQDIDLDAKLIHVRQVLVNGSSGPCPNSSHRDIPMSDALLRLFSRRHASRRPGTPHVFHTANGRAIDDGNFSRRTWVPLLVSLGLPGHPPKSMRSTAAAQFLSTGISPETVAGSLGIMDVGVFRKRYATYLATP
ncbi:tyrosine-type recombinase/integrase [Lysobacter soli]|uniref:tyrosine-type recombinase/integrase n=1 Tax=Lysobacter soli TaxID=453783 RepID=UPI00240F8B4A|nr:site-specific integrase [Lysobacter soli]MDG2519270.1 site-specific integrase [Lysobacter soli]